MSVYHPGHIYSACIGTDLQRQAFICLSDSNGQYGQVWAGERGLYHEDDLTDIVEAAYVDLGVANDREQALARLMERELKFDPAFLVEMGQGSKDTGRVLPEQPTKVLRLYPDRPYLGFIDDEAVLLRWRRQDGGCWIDWEGQTHRADEAKDVERALVLSRDLLEEMLNDQETSDRQIVAWLRRQFCAASEVALSLDRPTGWHEIVKPTGERIVLWWTGRAWHSGPDQESPDISVDLASDITYLGMGSPS